MGQHCFVLPIKWFFAGDRLSAGRTGDAITIRVVLVDDQALVRGGLAMVLGHQGDVEVVAKAGDYDIGY